jgi:hypothetical protein
MPITIEIRPGYAQIPVGSTAINYAAITIHPDLSTQHGRRRSSAFRA